MIKKNLFLFFVQSVLDTIRPIYYYVINTYSVMGLGGIPAMKYVSNMNNDHSMIASFDDCDSLSATFKSPTLRMVQLIAISVYSINEIIYSIVVIRIFVSNILKLSIYCREIKSNASQVNIILVYVVISVCWSLLM